MKDEKDIIGFVDTIPDMLGRLCMPVDRVDFVSDIKTIIQQWKEYKSLEEQGKLLKLSCAATDGIYRVYLDESGGKTALQELSINDVEKMFVCNCDGCRSNNTEECMHCMRAYSDCYNA